MILGHLLTFILQPKLYSFIPEPQSNLKLVSRWEQASGLEPSGGPAVRRERSAKSLSEKRFWLVS